MSSDTVNQNRINPYLSAKWYLFWLAILTGLVVGPHAVQSQATDKASLPLAYIQKITMPFITISVPAIPPAPPAKKHTTVQSVARESLDLANLQQKLAKSLDARLRSNIAVVYHIDVDNGASFITPKEMDAVLKTDLDRFGMVNGFERKMWGRVSTQVLRAGKSSQLLYATGVATASKRWIGKGYSLTDAQLVDSLASTISTRLIACLRKGTSSITATEAKFAIVPTFMPELVEMVVGKMGDTSKLQVNVPSLYRQADILFQPEVGPLSIVVREPNRISISNQNHPLPVLKYKEMIQLNALHAECERLGVDFLFVTNVESVDGEKELGVGEESLLIKTIRVDTTVDGLLYSLKDNRIIWRDIAEGGTVARMETIRGKPRIRTDEQCIVDSVRTAFAHLRSQFDDYLKVTDR